MAITIKRKKEQSGRVLILVLIILGVLTIFWTVALTSTGSELLTVGGRRSATQQLFDAEAGVATVVDTFAANQPTGPLATAKTELTVKDANNNDLARVTILPVQNDAAFAAANNLPRQDHEFDPPDGAGSGVNTMVAHRYVITSEVGGKIIQTGIYRMVPK